MAHASLLRLAARQETHDPRAEADQPGDLRSRYGEHLGVPGLERLDEGEHVLEPLAGDRMHRSVIFGVRDAEPQRREGGIDPAFLAPRRDAGEEFPQVRLGLEML